MILTLPPPRGIRGEFKLEGRVNGLPTLDEKKKKQFKLCVSLNAVQPSIVVVLRYLLAPRLHRELDFTRLCTISIQVYQ